jgi:hypothetical protein
MDFVNNQLDELENQATAAISNIKKEFKNMRDALKKREQELIEATRTIAEEKLALLARQLDELETMRDECKEVIDFTSDLLKSALSDSNGPEARPYVVASKDFLEARCKELYTQITEVRSLPHVDASVSVSFVKSDVEAVQLLCSSLGFIHSIKDEEFRRAYGEFCSDTNRNKSVAKTATNIAAPAAAAAATATFQSSAAVDSVSAVGTFDDNIARRKSFRESKTAQEKSGTNAATDQVLEQSKVQGFQFSADAKDADDSPGEAAENLALAADTRSTGMIATTSGESTRATLGEGTSAGGDSNSMALPAGIAFGAGVHSSNKSSSLPDPRLPPYVYSGSGINFSIRADTVTDTSSVVNSIYIPARKAKGGNEEAPVVNQTLIIEVRESIASAVEASTEHSTDHSLTRSVGGGATDAKVSGSQKPPLRAGADFKAADGRDAKECKDFLGNGNVGLEKVVSPIASESVGHRDGDRLTRRGKLLGQIALVFQVCMYVNIFYYAADSIFFVMYLLHSKADQELLNRSRVEFRR